MKQLEHAHRRLEHLYEIGKLLASFESVERTLDPALVIANQTLPLRSAMLVETDEGQSTMVSWAAAGQSAEQMLEGRRHLEGAYSYLVGAEASAFLTCQHEEHVNLPGPATPSVDLAQRFIVIPLVVGHRTPFGALQLEGARGLDKHDLMFVNAIANQLAVALERDRAWRKDIAQRTAAEILKEKYEALANENARLYEQAQIAIAQRERILAVVSHDLRTPLTTVLMTLQVLVKSQAPEERRKGLPEAIGRIQRSVERMNRLIDDLLDFVNIEAGRLAITRHSEDPALLIQETLASFEGAAREKHLQLTAHSALNLPQAYCDRDRILQVLSNMVGNAANATGAGGSIHLRAELVEHHLMFSVSDTGRGIGASDREHIFERYFRSEDSAYKGTGLGLAIAKGIVDAHGGKIWVESELNRGTTFFFTVPAVGTARAGEVALHS